VRRRAAAPSAAASKSICWVPLKRSLSTQSGLQFTGRPAVFFRAIKPLALLARRQWGHQLMVIERQIFTAP
jgi:hypothetical protein